MTTLTVAPAWCPSYPFVVSRDENISYGGGMRARLIFNSIWTVLNNSLSALGWFNSTVYDTPPGTKQYHPITFLAQQQNWDEPIEINTAAFMPEQNNDEYWEVGSLLTESRTTYYCDFFGESEALSIQFAGDIADILRGKLAIIGRGYGPTIDILDGSQTGAHYKIGYVWIENVTITRAPVYNARWMRYLRTVRFEALDYYDLDTDNLGVGRGHWSFLP
jgi:hypothetical protein